MATIADGLRCRQVICCKQFASLVRAHSRGLDGIRNAAAVEMTDHRRSPLHHPSCFVNMSFKARKFCGSYESCLRESTGVTLRCATRSALWECDAFRKQSRGQPSPRGHAASVVARKRRCITPSYENREADHSSVFPF